MGSLKEIADKIKLLFDSERQMRENIANPMVALESAVSLGGLHWTTKSIAQCENEATEESLKPLTDLLAKRWYYIKNTDASYFYNKTSVANQLYFEVAKILAESLSRDVYELLLPGLQGLDPTKKLHEYICSPNKNNPEQLDLILVADCFALLEKKYLQNQEVDLDIEDEQLLSSHSEASSEYYAALQGWTPGDLETLKTNFLTLLKSDEYKVNNQLGLYSNKALIPGILARITTKHEFISLLKCLPTDSWDEFLSKVDTSVLCKLMLGINDYDVLKRNLAPEEFTRKLIEKYDTCLKINPIQLDDFSSKYLRADFVIQHDLYERIKKLPQPKSMTSTLKSSVGQYIPTTGKIGLFVRNYMVTPPVDPKIKLKICNKNREHLLNENNRLDSIIMDDVACEGGSYHLLVEYMRRNLLRARELNYDATQNARPQMRL